MCLIIYKFIICLLGTYVYLLFFPFYLFLMFEIEYY